MKEILLHHKRTLKDLAGALGLPLTLLFRMKSGRDRVIMPFTSALKPALTEVHKVGCVLYLSLNLTLLTSITITSTIPSLLKRSGS
jgi:hypothetical protein